MIKKNSFWYKYHIDPMLFLFIFLLLLYSIFIMWSASGQNYNIMLQKLLQIFGGFLIMILLAQIPPRIYEFWSLYIYSVSLILLILVNIIGKISKGSQRWLDFGLIQFQPSEVMKISILLITAYYITRIKYPFSIKNIIIILLLVIIPSILILIQPDLGTAILTASSGLFMLFLSGINWSIIMFLLLLVLLLTPIFWCFFMHEYQKSRIIILLNPESDPLGSGYHIIQSKIAIGSGGFIGKGWLCGTQSQLEFLPERHTDFIFSVIGEELGLLGILILIFLYMGIIFRGFFLAIRSRTYFGRLITGSFILIFFMYIFINIAMVIGILPVVGVPLPLISYGGSSLLVLMAGFGILMSINGHYKMISKIL